MTTRDDLITLFQRLAANQQPVRLLNIYKGLPINNEAVIRNVQGPVIEVSTDRYQIVCMFLDREVYIQSPYLPNPVKAQIQSISPLNLSASLYGFDFVSKGIGERDAVRVEPEEKVFGILQVKDALAAIQGELADISQNGLGFFIDRNFFSPRHIHTGAEIMVTLKLPEMMLAEKKTSSASENTSDPMSRFSREQMRIAGVINTSAEKSRRNTASLQSKLITMQLRGEIVNVRPSLSSNRYRIGMKVFGDETSRQVIASFISKRQSELIRELKTMYEAITRFNQQPE